MIEYSLIIVVCFFIAVLFYKQANEEFQILQLDADRFDELPTLYSERSPIVMSMFQTPNLGTEESLLKRGRYILDLKVKPNLTLGELLTSKELSTFQFPFQSATFLAKESGLTVWFEQHLFKKLLPAYTHWIYSFYTTLWPDHCGLFKTTAFQTVLMPTQGTASVKLLLPKMIPYLPTRWEGRRFSTLSPQDTPLLNEIQFIEIKIRKGNLLLLPAHLIVDIESIESSWIFMGEMNHPISYLASFSRLNKQS